MKTFLGFCFECDGRGESAKHRWRDWTQEGRSPTHVEAGGQAGLRLKGGPGSPHLRKKDEVKGRVGVLGAQERRRGFQPAPGARARGSGRAEGCLKALPTGPAPGWGLSRTVCGRAWEGKGPARLTQRSCFPGGLAGNRERRRESGQDLRSWNLD